MELWTFEERKKPERVGERCVQESEDTGHTGVLGGVHKESFLIVPIDSFDSVDDCVYETHAKKNDKIQNDLRMAERELIRATR